MKVRITKENDGPHKVGDLVDDPSCYVLAQLGIAEAVDNEAIAACAPYFKKRAEVAERLRQKAIQMVAEKEQREAAEAKANTEAFAQMLLERE